MSKDRNESVVCLAWRTQVNRFELQFLLRINVELSNV